MRDFSGRGSTAVLVLFTAVTAGYLALAGAPTTASIVATAVVTGWVGVSWLKAGFGRLRPASAGSGRVRPDADLAVLIALGMGCPSGHAGVSAIVFLTLGALLASTRSRTIERTYVLAMASLTTLLVGLSRLALGVHLATEVLAGWAFGAALAGLAHAGSNVRKSPAASAGHAYSAFRNALPAMVWRSLPCALRLLIDGVRNSAAQ